MIGKETTDEKPITLARALEILKERKKMGELEYSQRLAYDYAQKFAELNAEEAEKLVRELLEIEKIREHQAVILADLMPKTKDEIQLIFAKERTSLGDGDIKKILELIYKYRK